MKYNLGITLILLAYGLSLFLLYSYFFHGALIVFILGTICIFLSGKKMIVKLLSVFIPLVLWLPFFKFSLYMTMLWDSTHTKMRLIVNENFEGSVVLVNNVPCAAPFNKVMGAEEIEVPDHGAVLCRRNYEITEMFTKFYCRQDDGRLTRIFPSWKSNGKRIKARDNNALELYSTGASGTSVTINNYTYTYTTTTAYITHDFGDDDQYLNGDSRTYQVIDSLLVACLTLHHGEKH